MEEYEDSIQEDIYSYEKDTIVPRLAEVKYLGYQVFDIDMEDIISLVNELINNSFIMERMGERETEVIIHLAESLRLLNAFIQVNDDNLFLRTDITIGGLEIEKYPSELENVDYYSLYYREKDADEVTYEQNLDKKILPNVYNDRIMSVYVVNPDKYIIFDDLITEVISSVDDWRNTGAGNVYFDIESGQIGLL